MTHREAAEDLAEFERTGGPAFPWDGMGDDGMTLRDYFAAKAMAALIAEPPWGDGTDSMLVFLSRDFKGTPDARFALVAYKLADAMLKARNA
jgi:hypothetical protein